MSAEQTIRRLMQVANQWANLSTDPDERTDALELALRHEFDRNYVMLTAADAMVSELQKRLQSKLALEQALRRIVAKHDEWARVMPTGAFDDPLQDAVNAARTLLAPVSEPASVAAGEK